MADSFSYKPYDQPAGGWGSMRSLARHSVRQGAVASGAKLIGSQNKPGGYMCVSCAWAKPAEPHIAEFCENGAKATFWELTSKRTTPIVVFNPLKEKGWLEFVNPQRPGQMISNNSTQIATDYYRKIGTGAGVADENNIGEVDAWHG